MSTNQDASKTTPRFELFAFWRTSATYRVRVALNLKGLTAHERIVDLDAGEQRSPSFLAINPLGAIPALVDHENEGDAAGNERAPLTQSSAILEYLEEVHPSPPLLPADPYGRARVRGPRPHARRRHPSAHHAAGEEVPHERAQVRRRGLESLADALVLHRLAGGRAAALP